MRSLDSFRRDRFAPGSYRSYSRSPFEDFVNEVERNFFPDRDRWGTEERSAQQSLAADFAPAVDIEESDGMFLITADLPGLKIEDIKIDINDRMLRVSGERRRESRSENPEGGYSERSYGRFYRGFTLPEGVDPKKIEAHFEDGVLRVLLPKSEVRIPQEIKIQSGEHRGLLDRFFGSSKERPESKGSNKPEENRPV